MENNETISDSFSKELDAISSDTILDPAFRRKKLILWTIRAMISIVLYVIFWKYEWVKWTLLLTIPLSFFSLFTIIGAAYLLKRKIKKTKRKIEEADKIIHEPTNQ